MSATYSRSSSHSKSQSVGHHHHRRRRQRRLPPPAFHSTGLDKKPSTAKFDLHHTSLPRTATSPISQGPGAPSTFHGQRSASPVSEPAPYGEPKYLGRSRRLNRPSRRGSPPLLAGKNLIRLPPPGSPSGRPQWPRMRVQYIGYAEEAAEEDDDDDDDESTANGYPAPRPGLEHRPSEERKLKPQDHLAVLS